MPKGYWETSGKFLKGIGNPLGTPKYPLSANRRGDRIAQRLLAKTWQIPSIFFEVLRFCLFKSQWSCGKFLKCSAVLLLFLLFQTIPLLARLKLVRQSL
jgi:hypothetical protein